MDYSPIQLATIGHVSSTMGYPVLDHLFTKDEITRNEKLLLYLFINLASSKEQLLKVSCYKNEQLKNLFVYTKRLEEKKLIEKFKSEADGNKLTLFHLTRKGVNEVKKIFADRFSQALQESSKLNVLFQSVNKDSSVSPSDCAEYIAEQYLKFNFGKKQYAHFVGERDVPTAFLSNIGYSSPYTFSCFHEVEFTSSGEPLSVYERLYKNKQIYKSDVRSDTVLTFHVAGRESDTINLYAEYDTGTQGGATLKEKVTQYVNSVFLPLVSKRPAILPYLVFFISDKVSEKDVAPTERMDFKTRERYLARGLSLAASTYMALHEDMYSVSLYDFRDFLNSISLSRKDREDFLPFVDSCINEVGGDKNVIDIVDKLYERSKHGDEDKENMYRQKWEHYYKNRSHLLYSVIDEIPDIKKLFLSGISICAISSRLGESARTFLPECCGMRLGLIKTFSTAASPVRVTGLRALSRFSLQEGDIVLRNVYQLSDGRNVAVENIGNDYGAYHRVKHLLETDFAPCEILCTFSILDADRVRELFLPHRGKKCLSHFYVSDYIFRENEIEKTKERTSAYTCNSVSIPEAISARDFIS